jgi:hypothetical protein
MLRRKSVVHRINKIVANSSSSTSDNHELLSANHEKAIGAHTASLDTGSSSVMTPHRRGIVQSRMYTLRSTLTSGSLTTQCKFVFLSCTIKK